ncbi:MAG: hypothetical protein QM723_02210 [Myxococcaceae bacterium]
MRSGLLAASWLLVIACTGVIGSESSTGGGAAAGGGAADAGATGGGGAATGGGTVTGGGSASGGGASAGGGSATGGGAATGGGSATGGGGSATGGGGGGMTDAGFDGGFDAGDPFSTDRNTFFGSSRCADAGFLLCDDFESGTLDTSTWSKVGGAVTVEQGDHARGSWALHVKITGNGAAYIRETKTFPAPNNAYWGRAFYKFIALPTSADMSYSHWTILAASGSVVDGEIRVSGQLSNGKNLFGVGTDNRSQATGTGDWTSSDKDPNNMPRAVPLNEWECLEWLHDGQNNETRFFWDDVEHPSLHTTSSVNGGNGMPYLLPQFTDVWVGWQEYQTATEPFELWVDEVAIDSQRIGCVR